jgi:hypothetical protein
MKRRSAPAGVTAAARGDIERARLGHVCGRGLPVRPMVLAPLPQASAQPTAPPLAKRAITRQARADQLRRARAAAQVLRAAFPQVEQLRIELTFADRSSISPAAQVHMLYPPARAFFTFPCPHSDCEGEFELEGAVRIAMSGGTHIARGSVLCEGARPSEKGSRRRCELQLTYVITAVHRGGA